MPKRNTEDTFPKFVYRDSPGDCTGGFTGPTQSETSDCSIFSTSTPVYSVRSGSTEPPAYSLTRSLQTKCVFNRNGGSRVLSDTRQNDQSNSSLLSNSGSEYSSRSGSTTLLKSPNYPPKRPLKKGDDIGRCGQKRDGLDNSEPYFNASAFSSLVSGNTAEFSVRTGSTVQLNSPRRLAGGDSFFESSRTRAASRESPESRIANPHWFVRDDELELLQHPPGLPPPRRTYQNGCVPPAVLDRPLPSIPNTPSSYRNCVRRTTRSSSSSRRSLRRSSRDSPFLQRRCLVIIVIISLSFSVLTSGFAAFCFFHKLLPTQEDNTYNEGDYEVCVPCSLLRHFQPEGFSVKDLLHIKTDASKETVCCARNSGQMSALIDNVLKQRTNRTIPHQEERQKFYSSPISAHIYLRSWVTDYTDQPTSCDTKHCRVKMYAQAGCKHEHIRNISIRNNKLEVPHSGLYFIYSSINISPRPDRRPCSQLSNKTFRHIIMRTQSGADRSDNLAETAHTCCDTCTDGNHTSYVGGVFKLNKTDQIYLEAFGSNQVLFQDDGSYMGLVMLSSEDLTRSSPIK